MASCWLSFELRERRQRDGTDAGNHNEGAIRDGPQKLRWNQCQMLDFKRDFVAGFLFGGGAVRL